MKVEIATVLDLLRDKSKHVLVETAPAVRVALGELFGYPLGTALPGKMVSALRKVGFEAVFDGDFGADITVWEEGAEFLRKVRNGGPFPHFTSCCIGWVLNVERTYPDLLPYLSTTKSPLGCFGSVAKTYYAKKMGYRPEDIVVVSVVPCILKKNENEKPYNVTHGLPDVDYTWTTKDLGAVLKGMGIELRDLPDSPFDDPLGESTQGGTGFGKEGGVLSSCLKSARYWDDGTIDEKPLLLTPNPSVPDIREGTYVIAGKKLLVAHCGMVGIRTILPMVREHTCPYAFVEVMACPGGCIMGAGQPLHLPSEGLSPLLVRTKRKEALTSLETGQKPISPLNASLRKIYAEQFDGKPLSEKAEEELHRRYH
jgi:NADP-reducing hydrogenase subunit HndD